MKRSRLFSLLFMTNALLVWYAPTAVVSAFGVHQQRPKTMELIGSSSTERGYGQAVDVDISLPTRMSTSTTTTKTLERTPQVPYSIATSLPSAGRRRHDYMVRPKSLHSSSHTLKKYPDLLSKQEEIDFTTSIRNMRSVMRRRDDLLSEGGRSEPTEEQWAEACRLSVSSLRRTMQEGQEARSKLVAANGGLVHSIAKRYYASLKSANKDGILTLQDMVQEGNMGLMEAAERFDPSKGFRFSTYATWWVRQRVLKSISEYSRVIRLPAHVHTMLNKIHKARNKMQKEIGREPSVPELAHYLEMSVEKLQMYTDKSRSVLSLESPLGQNRAKGEPDRRTLGDKIASDSPTPVENAEVESLRTVIRAVLSELADRERDVLVLRFGLDDGSPRSVEETSKRLGISRDRVRTVEARALNKLRHPQRNYKLKEYVGADAKEEEMTVTEEETSTMSPERIWSF